MKLPSTLPASAALGLMLLFLVGCQSDQQAAANGADVARPPAAVDVRTLVAKDIELKETSSGRVAAFREAEVRPQISGIIQKRLFEEGSTVKKGDVLYQVDPAPYQAALESAKAGLAVAQADLNSTRNKAERYRKLAAQLVVSKQDTEDTTAAWKLAEAQIQVAKAAIQSANINLGYTRITAPISGIISRSSVTEGALVSAQQTTALATIRQLSPVYVDIKRNALTAMKSSQQTAPEVLLTLEDGTAYPETGVLKSSESSVDEGTGMLNARALFENKDGLLLPGMFVRASLATETVKNALLVPQQGIQRTPDGGTSALVVNAENKVESREVTVTEAIADQWLVRSGLIAGDRVIYSGLQKVKVGDTVQPLEDGKPVDDGSKAAGSGESDDDDAGNPASGQKQE